MHPFLILVTTFFILASSGHREPGSDQDNGLHRLGVTVSSDTRSELTRERIQMLQEIGITLIEIEGRVPDVLPGRLQNSDIYLFVRQERRFVTNYRLTSDFDRFLIEDIEWIRFHDRLAGERIAAYGLFQYPDVHSPVLVEQLNRYSELLLDETDPDILLYYQTAFSDEADYPENFAFRSLTLFGNRDIDFTAPAIHYLPGRTSPELVSEFRDVLSQSLQLNETVIFVDLDWLLEMIGQFEPLRDSIREYTAGEQIRFPLPDEDPPLPSLNWLVIFLLVSLTTYMIHYRYNTLYRRSLFRYFYMHKFFVDDLMEFRLRSNLTGSVLLAQNAFNCGLFAFLSARLLFTQAGLDVLFYHFPVLQTFGTGALGFFLWGMVLAAGMQILSVLWIYIPNTSTKALSQTMNLYGWPLHLNFLVLVLMVTIYQAGGSPGMLHFLAALFLFIWFFSFNLAAIDSGRFLKRHRVTYILFTVGLHFLIFGGLILYILLSPELLEPILFAYRMP